MDATELVWVEFIFMLPDNFCVRWLLPEKGVQRGSLFSDMVFPLYCLCAFLCCPETRSLYLSRPHAYVYGSLEYPGTADPKMENFLQDSQGSFNCRHDRFVGIAFYAIKILDFKRYSIVSRIFTRKYICELVKVFPYIN